MDRGYSMLIATLALQAAQPLPNDDGWARFSAHQARSRIEVDVTIGSTRSARGDVIYWIRRSTKRPGQWVEVSSTDSVRCPAVLAMLQSMHDLPAPRPAPPVQGGGDIVVTADGTDYELHAPIASPGMEVTLSSNVGTPLAAWVEQSLAALGPCLPPVL
jgi:hypothetical protein